MNLNWGIFRVHDALRCGPGRVAWSLALVAMLSCAGAASAQRPLAAVPDPHEPGVPADRSGGWDYTRINISTLPAGYSLGALWIRSLVEPQLPGMVAGAGAKLAASGSERAGEPGGVASVLPIAPPILYVWATRGVNSTGIGGYNAIPDPGGSPPDPGGDITVSSRLYAWNGQSWSVVLDLPGMTGRSVYGTGVTDVYAAAVTASGMVRMYRYDGVSWAQQALPLDHRADAGTIAGRIGDIYFRAGEHIMRYDGQLWRMVFTEPALADGGALVYVAADEVYAIGPRGHAKWNGTDWRSAPAPELAVVNHAWGARGGSGALDMYAVGTEPGSSEIRLWKFNEDPTGVIIGDWGSPDGIALIDPDPGAPSLGPRAHGAGLAVQGTPSGAVYAIGTCHDRDCGRFYAGAGEAWQTLWQHDTVTPVNDVTSAGEGDLWFSLASGQLLHAVSSASATNLPPETANATADPALLWPHDRRWVPIRILGVVDPEGGAVTIRVTGITQDEPVVGVGESRLDCPDGVIGADGAAELRAERAHDGNGRVYRVAFEATDALGGVSTGTVDVGVPYCPRPLCGPEIIDDGQSFNSAGPCAVCPPHGGRGRGSLVVSPRSGTAYHLGVSLSEPAFARLVAFDVTGRRVATIGQGYWNAGTHEVEWDANGLAAGLYFCRLTAGPVEITKRVLIRR